MNRDTSKLFSWIHLSDIHFQFKGETVNDALIRQSLPEFLGSISGNEKYDAIIITGDFRYAPRKEQTGPDKVYEYIKTISKELNVDDRNVIIVPGNHDLDRSKKRTYLLNGVKVDYNPYLDGCVDFEVLRLLTLEDFDFYKLIQKRFPNGLEIKEIKDEEGNPHEIREIGNCFFLLLNTSIIAGTNEDQKQLIVGSNYVNALLALRSLDKPIFVVGHHGMDMLRNDEKRWLTTFLNDHDVRLYLCGHTHKNWIQPFCKNSKSRQITVGCMSQGRASNAKVIAGFSVGVLYKNGDVGIDMYKWNKIKQKWQKDNRHSIRIDRLYSDKVKNITRPSYRDSIVEKKEWDFTLIGSRLLGGLGIDGIKYIWKNNYGKYVESLAYNRRVRLNPTDDDEKTTSYTISTSVGCELSSFGLQCAFCETGKNTYMPLTAEDIALQCIFMALYDSDCPGFRSISLSKREFVFNGQGEPGINYSLIIKRAILLTDIAMEKIKQKVSRYVIYTCGIKEFIPNLIVDLQNKVFKNKVSVHFSLNAIDDDRDVIMPINKHHPYDVIFEQCRSLYDVTKEKIDVGILLMVNYMTNDGRSISLDTSKLAMLLSDLDPKIFRIELQLVNKTSLGVQRQLRKEDTRKYEDFVQKMNFECNVYASFGDTEESGCGMLSSSLKNINNVGSRTTMFYNKAIGLLLEARKELDNKK